MPANCGSIRVKVAVNFWAIQLFTQLRFAQQVASEQHNRSERSSRASAATALRLTAVAGSRTRAGGEATGHPLTGCDRCWAHACRDDEVVCGRVELTVSEDKRLGLAPRERRRFAARFVGHLHPTLRTELVELVRRRGMVARRAAERMAPIELVFDDPGLGLQRIVGWVQSPQRRHGDLCEIEFDLREPTR